MPAIADYFTKASSGTRPVPTTTTATVASGASPGTITCSALTGWPTTTPVHFVIYTTDTSGAKVAGSQIDCKGIVVGNTITGTIVKAGTNLGFSVGAIVEAAPTAAYADDLATGLAVSHNADGSLSTTAVNTALGLSSTIGAGWTPLAQTFTYGANNGNKEFTVTATADLSATLSPGMRMQLTRGTTAPTQSMAFTAASSQYATKASPTGITFTTAFTCEAWVYLNSYTGQAQHIISRTDNTTAGFGFRANASAQLELFYGTASSFTSTTTNQSVPLKRWVHVAAVVSSVASKTVSFYINGVSSSATQGGTATSLTHTGNLTVGSVNAGGLNTYFDGYISEARIWSAAQTQASIQANMGINLVGNETNLVALFKGNGNFTDTTANANTLTATNGAIATQAANPFNNVEYSIITKVSYSAPTTTLTLFGGTDYNIPNMTLSSPQYSALKSPVGFNSSRGKWLVESPLRITSFQSTPTQNTWYNQSSWQLSIPTGEWVAGYDTMIYGDRASAAAFHVFGSLSTSNSSESERNLTTGLNINAAQGGAGLSVRRPISLSAQTTYYLISKTDATSMSSVYNALGDREVSNIIAECAWA